MCLALGFRENFIFLSFLSFGYFWANITATATSTEHHSSSSEHHSAFNYSERGNVENIME